MYYYFGGYFMNEELIKQIGNTINQFNKDKNTNVKVLKKH